MVTVTGWAGPSVVLPHGCCPRVLHTLGPRGAASEGFREALSDSTDGTAGAFSLSGAVLPARAPNHTRGLKLVSVDRMGRHESRPVRSASQLQVPVQDRTVQTQRWPPMQEVPLDVATLERLPSAQWAWTCGRTRGISVRVHFHDSRHGLLPSLGRPRVRTLCHLGV